MLGGSIEQDNWEREALVETGQGINESLPLNLAEVEPRGRLDGDGGDLQLFGYHCCEQIGLQRIVAEREEGRSAAGDVNLPFDEGANTVDVVLKIGMEVT